MSDVQILCDPIDYSLPVSSVPGILQARILDLQGIFPTQVQDLMFLSKGHRDLRFAFQTHPGSQASCQREERTPLSFRVATGTSWSPLCGLKVKYLIRPNIALDARKAVAKTTRMALVSDDGSGTRNSVWWTLH